MDYLKRLAMPKSWPLARKNTRGIYIIKPKASLEKSISLVVILRDLLKMAKVRKEIKKIVNAGDIQINCKKINDERLPVQLFDVISIQKIKKYYMLSLTKNGKLSVIEINESESHKKVCKIIGKTALGGKKIQLNLDDGRNFFSNEGKVNDSVLIDLKQKKILKVMPVKEKANVKITNGKMAGHDGVISKIEGIGKKRIIHVNFGKKIVKTAIENLMVVE